MGATRPIKKYISSQKEKGSMPIPKGTGKGKSAVGISSTKGGKK